MTGNRFEDSSQRAAKLVDKALAKELKKLSEIHEDTINNLVPSATDRKKIKELVKSVNKTTKNNERVNLLIDFCDKASEGLQQIVKKIMEA